jgi:CHAT domain-containing protein
MSYRQPVMSRVCSWQGALATALLVATTTPTHAATQGSALKNPAAPPAPLANPSSPARSEFVREAEAADEMVKKISDRKQRDFTYPRSIEAQQQALRAWQKTGLTDEINARRVLLATFLWRAGDLRLGEQVIKEALQTHKLPGSPTDYYRRLSVLMAAGLIAREAGDYHSAIGYYREIVEIGKKLRDSPDFTITASNTLAAIYSDLGEFDEANKIALASRHLLKSYKGSKPMTSPWHNLLFADLGRWFWLGEINKAMLVLDEVNQMYASALAESKESDRSSMRAMASMVQAFACAKPAESSRILSRPLSFTPSGSRSESSPSPSPSPARINQTAKDQSQGYGFSEDIDTAKTQENWGAEAAFLRLEAGLAQDHGDYNQAVNLIQRALALARMRHAAPQEAELVNELAEITIDQGKLQQGLQLLQQAFSLQAAMGLRPAQTKTLWSLSLLYRSLGANMQALGYTGKALELAKSLSFSGEEIRSLMLIASIQKRQQQLPDAEQALLQAKSIADRTGNCWEQSQVHNQMATLLADSGNLSDAAVHAAKAEALASLLLTDDTQLLGKALAKRVKAITLLKQGNPQAAAKEAEDALRFIKQRNTPRHQTHILTTLAEAHVAMGNLPKAIALYQQQLDLLTTMNLPPEKAQILYAIAQLQRGKGDGAAALAAINQAIAIVEAMRKQVVDPELRTSFFASKQDFYTFKIDLLLEWDQQQTGAGHAAEAFHTSERSRARTLLELLDDARTDIRQGITPDLLEQEQALQYRQTALDKRWQQAFSENSDPSALPRLQQQRQQLLQQREELRQTIRARAPRYAALTDAEPLRLAQVQQQLLDADTVLLQYSLGKERSFLFVVSRNDLQVLPLPAAAEINALVEALRSPLTLNEDRKEIHRRAAALSQQVLAPASGAIGRHRRVIVVADGALQLVPFAALPLEPNSSDSPNLGDKHLLLHLPSSSTLALIRQQRERVAANRPTSLAILADPVFSAKDPRLSVAPADRPSSAMQAAVPNPSSSDLRALSFQRASASLEDCDKELPYCRLGYTRTEAMSLASMLPDSRVSLSMDFGADLNRATSLDLSRYSHVHFATHGLFNGKQPALSGLLLSRVDRNGKAKDGFLQIGDIFNLKLNADLVVLSACETGLGSQVQGEGLVGITRGFLYAGSPRVLVSLWQVSDEATATFMTSFYEAMLQRKMPASQALLAAQKELRANPKWISPYYWAAFVLQGEW